MLIKNLNKKNKAGGLTMTEINSLKRYYQKNFRFGYQKDPTKTAEQVMRATNIDKALREFQVQKAIDNGFEDISRLNMETAAAKDIIDALGEKKLRQMANNSVSLTDWIVASGGGVDPASISALIGKKLISTDAVQGAAARKLAPKPTVGAPKADTDKIMRKQRIKELSQ